MNLKFENANTEMTLNNNFIMNVSSYERRVNSQDRYGKDGGVITGDQMVDSRKITFSFNPVAGTDSSYLEIVNDIIGFFNVANSPFYLVDSDTDRRCEIVLLSADDEAQAEGLERRIGKNKLQFEMIDGHWEDNTANYVYSETAGISSGDTLTVNNSADIDCFPIITVEPYQVNTTFTIKNITTGALITLGSNNFSPGSDFVIDSQEGTVYLYIGNSIVELSSAMADGSGFIKLVPGVNELEYTSAYGDVDIEVEFRRRYAF